MTRAQRRDGAWTITPPLETDMPEHAPRDNPYRLHESTDGYAVEAPASASLTLDDLERLLAHRERLGYTTGYQERGAVADRQRASVYDEGWRAGMAEQHDLVAGAIGGRLDVLNELLHLLPVASAAGLPAASDLSEHIPVVGAAVRSMMVDLMRGPYDMPLGERRVPENSIASEMGRVEQLRDWLALVSEEMARRTGGGG
jgi:hypothetical protein